MQTGMLGETVTFKLLMFIILIVAAFADLCIPVFLGSKYPGYSHLKETISTLGTRESPVKKQESLNLILVGILLIIFSLGQRSAFNSMGWSHYLYLLGICAFGIGCLFAGFFPEDPKGSVESVSGKIHGISSGTGFILLVMNPLWAVFINDFSKYKLLNGILFISGMITFTLFFISKNKKDGLLKYTGLFQRLNLIVLYGCLIANFNAVCL